MTQDPLANLREKDRPKQKPHKAKHKMNKGWSAGAAEVAASIPGATAGDENDGVQRMYDAIADADQTPQDRAYAALDAYADSAEHFAALARSSNSPADECIAMAKHLLMKTLSHIDDLIAPSVKNGHKAA